MEDCRNCKQYGNCPCGKRGHDNGTSIGYSIGECKDYESKNNLSPRFPYRMERAKWYLMFLLLEQIISFEEFEDLYGRLPEEYK